MAKFIRSGMVNPATNVVEVHTFPIYLANVGGDQTPSKSLLKRIWVEAVRARRDHIALSSAQSFPTPISQGRIDARIAVEAAMVALLADDTKTSPAYWLELIEQQLQWENENVR